MTLKTSLGPFFCLVCRCLWVFLFVFFFVCFFLTGLLLFHFFILVPELSECTHFTFSRGLIFLMTLRLIFSFNYYHLVLGDFENLSRCGTQLQATDTLCVT